MWYVTNPGRIIRAKKRIDVRRWCLMPGTVSGHDQSSAKLGEPKAKARLTGD
jgi:hypothetical protein